jgi:hypothetical protein
MGIRRMIVWITSAIFGATSVFFTTMIFHTSTTLLPLTSTILIFLSFYGLAFLWLDYFLKTQYLQVENWI